MVLDEQHFLGFQRCPKCFFCRMVKRRLCKLQGEKPILYFLIFVYSWRILKIEMTRSSIFLFLDLPARYHQFFHMLRAAYLRAACGVPANPLASTLSEKELGPHDVPIIQCPVRVSLAADAICREEVTGVQRWSHHPVGVGHCRHVTEKEISDWCFGGDQQLWPDMNACRGGFKDLLWMTQVPEVDHEDGFWQVVSIYVYINIHIFVWSFQSCNLFSICICLNEKLHTYIYITT